MQANSAAQQHRPLARGTHAKGVCARAQFEVLDVTAGRDPQLAARLAKGIFAKPGVYPAVVRWGNADSKKNSDFKPDVRSMSFSVDLTREWRGCFRCERWPSGFFAAERSASAHQRLPCICGDHEGVGRIEPASGLLSLPFKDKLRVIRILTLAKLQSSQKIRPYQQLRYWSNVPFRHGPIDVVQYSAIPSPAIWRVPCKRATRKACRTS